MMYRDQHNAIVYSPSDLIRFMESPFASWMERLRLEHRELAVRDQPSEESELIAKTGGLHEAAYLRTLKESGRDVCEIPRGDDASARTRKAMAAHREVIFQGYLTTGPFAGYTDFLVLGDGGLYQVWDTKLARKVKPYFLVQLCCFAEMLGDVQGARPENVCVVLGDNDTRKFRTNDYYYYYSEVKKAFLAQMESFSAEADPPVPDPRADHGLWQSHADDWLQEHDHLVQVAGISIGQIGKLNAAGIQTLKQLAETDAHRIPKLNDERFRKLTNQARVQLATRVRQLETTGGEATVPVWEPLPPIPSNQRSGLATLPPGSLGDVYFDIEGYPLFDQGLEYLLGAVVTEAAEPEFHDWWAHDHKQEKASFEAFIDWVYARWLNDPSMHVYHYAPYEVTAMRRLSGKYATREDEVDTFLRNNVFVDLYRIVGQSLLIGGSNYSLKTVEQLYPGQRSGDVKTAAASMVYYAQWIESQEPEDWQSSSLLREIRDYNEVDCVSTWQLAKWLRGLQEKNGLQWIPPFDNQDSGTADTADGSKEQRPPLKEDDQARRNLAIQLLSQVPDDETERNKDLDQWLIQELLGYLVEFHRREAKPIWWAWFDRLTKTEEELVEDIECLAGLERTETTPTSIKRSMVFEYAFDPSQETRIAKGSKVAFSHSPANRTEVFEFNGEGTLWLKFGAATVSKMDGGTMPSHVSLIPYEYVDPGHIPGAIQRVAEDWQDNGRVSESLRRFLLRLPPRITGIQQGQSLIHEDEDVVNGCVRIVRNMQDSTLCIQGPPGAGKTYTASHMILALLKDGKNIGITSNSHSAIMNVMRACFETTDATFAAMKVGGDEDDPLFDEWRELKYVKGGSAAVSDYQEGLVGGTAWFFSNPGIADRLDYLFVDEAGQVSVANLVAMSRSTDNIVLIGDQMQLGQPTRGSHPGDTGLSLLEYLLGDHAVIPSELGVFLGETWRMHPTVCDFISRTIYEGRLQPHRSTVRRIVEHTADETHLVNAEAGIVFIPVKHFGNTQSSEQEVEAIVSVTDELLGRTHYDRKSRPLDPIAIDDILYVAPYNMQVRSLRERLPEGARVGSVDKFQGQEAPIVIVSLCSSAGEFGARGIDFVLNRNRFNVAISRAQSLAIVVGDPEIAHTSVTSIKEMESVNLFCTLLSASTQ